MHEFAHTYTVGGKKSDSPMKSNMLSSLLPFVIEVFYKNYVFAGILVQRNYVNENELTY